MPASTYSPFVLPDADTAMSGLRNLQTQGVGGLSALMGGDYDASRQQFQDALYTAQEEPLTRAMEEQLNRLVEGQFGRGTGLSTRTQDMTGEVTQQYFDALSRAGRESYLGAGAENRADLAARQGLYTGGFNAGTQGLQAEANVGLQNAANAQQAAQFGQQQGMQQAQMAQQARQFDATMQQNYSQLAQQAQQFGATLDFNTQQALMNRAQQMTLAQMQNQFGYAQLNQQGNLAGQQLGFNYAQLGQQGDLANQQLGFNYAQLGQQGDLAGQQLGFNYAQLGQQGGLAMNQQDLQRQIAANNLALQYAQLGQQGSQFTAGLDQRADAQRSAAIGAGLTGLAGLFAPTVNAAGGAANDWLMNLFGIQPSSGITADDIVRALGGGQG